MRLCSDSRPLPCPLNPLHPVPFLQRRLQTAQRLGHQYRKFLLEKLYPEEPANKSFLVPQPALGDFKLAFPGDDKGIRHLQRVIAAFAMHPRSIGTLIPMSLLEVNSSALLSQQAVRERQYER